MRLTPEITSYRQLKYTHKAGRPDLLCVITKPRSPSGWEHVGSLGQQTERPCAGATCQEQQLRKTQAPEDAGAGPPAEATLGAEHLLESARVGFTPQDRGENACFRGSQGNQDA
ncbi:hypothetical protein NDU88_005178 [Pleurodeles waltl]|uniref:Uncharacterized protein n=1 Tax=Pleurodeles waltl TaxID=8319 RepID=A0AAV7WB50_PLEWA|nr:hypothetical protein NDU88_005178 [Pleurodeles waltl]